MKKILLIIAALAVGFVAGAQNNAYEIDDECYELFKKCEKALGTGAFKEVSEDMLHKAIVKNDKKAQLLYYVEILKDATARLRAYSVTTNAQDEEVMEKMHDVQSLARSSGYIQYYYYAFDLAQSHFYNHGKSQRTMELIQEMRKIALDNDEPYGVWKSDCYVAQLYISLNDFLSAKQYIISAIRTYETSKDPTIRRQSPARLYCDLANTYPVGHDSARINIAKAEANCKQYQDTVRVMYHKAKLAAYYGDVAEYEKDRDYCKSQPFLSSVSPTAEKLFDDIDILVYGNPETDNPDMDITGMNRHLKEVKYLANIAEVMGYKELAFKLEKSIVDYDETVLAQSNRSRLMEAEARLGNDALRDIVHEQELEAARSQRRIFLLILSIFALIIIFFIFYNRFLARAKKQDEARILELEAANEKVRLADAAKTRFVQNMSHEVRTPLNAIVGFSQLLSLPDGSFPEEEKEEFAGHIVNNTKMLTMLLDDILSTSAVDGGKYKITYEEGETHFMAQAAISSAEHRLQPGVRLYYSPENEEPFTFTTDPRRVQQILINLITNACKHTKQGEIKVSSSLTEAPGYVSYSITDTGPGVPADKAEAIFERFTKLDEFVQGTGLGLSICRDIASLMGAKVFLDTSYTAGGARFVFQVPVNPPANNQ